MCFETHEWLDFRRWQYDCRHQVLTLIVAAASVWLDSFFGRVQTQVQDLVAGEQLDELVRCLQGRL